MNDAFERAAALRQVAQRGQPDSPPQGFAGALLRCCEDLIDAGEPTVALELLTLSEGIRSLDEETELKLESLRAHALCAAGRYVESLGAVRQILSSRKSLLATIPPESHRLRITQAKNLWQLNRPSEAIDDLLSLRSELLTLPDSRLLAACAFHLLTALLVKGKYDAARVYAFEAIVSSRRSGDRRLEALALDNLSRLERALCRWTSAHEAADLALTIFRQLGARFEINACRRGLGIIAWKRGNLEEALNQAEWCLEDGKRNGTALLEAYATLFVSTINLHLGRFQDAARLLEQSQEVGRAYSRPSLLTTEFLGDIHLEQGEAEAALRYYNEVWPKALALVPKGDIVAELRRRRAECYHLLGRHEEAYAEAQTGLSHCRELGDRYEEAATYRVLGLCAAAVGKPREAKAWFEQGFAYYDDIETPYEWGKLWLAYGDWLRRAEAEEYRDEKGALEAYQAARELFERIGAAAKLKEAERRLPELAPATRPAPVPTSIAFLARETVTPATGFKRPARRPKGWSELERRSRWARESFGVITRHKPLLSLLETVAKLAKGKSPVLVLGESGTGKELVAQGIHRLSGCAGKFVPINCGAIPKEMVESELFGHVAGAFTGATRDKPGMLEMCEGGTALLDEVAELTAEQQTRLLRFLETGQLRRVGAVREVRVETRVVAATNREREALERGEGMRRDLYYRLAHAVVVLPPLRRRGEDVELLVGEFLGAECERLQKEVRLSGVAWERLRKHPWPGNVRQLKAMIEQVVLVANPGHEVGEGELDLGGGPAPASLTEELEQAERGRIVEALRAARGSRTEAAQLLGMPRTTMLNKMKRYGIT